MKCLNKDGKMAYREFKIRKRNGKFRRICAPDKKMLQYQRSKLNQLTTKFKSIERSVFRDEVFHGFIKGRNCVTAAIKHIGYRHTLTLDISNFFDSVMFDRLNNQYGNILDSIDKKQVTHEDGSLAQGFATSPILASLYLIPAIRELQDVANSIFKDSVITVYADDIQVSFNEDSYDLMNLFVSFAKVTMKKWGLEINPRKTRIRHAKYGNRCILGIQVGENAIFPHRKLKKKIRAARHQNNGPSLGGLITSAKLLLPRHLRE